MNNLIKELVSVAKLLFGEHKEELIGYEIGRNCYVEIVWSEEVKSIEHLELDYFYPYVITKEDIEKRLESKEDWFFCCNNQIVIARIMKETNKGWKKTLFEMINKIE